MYVRSDAQALYGHLMASVMPDDRITELSARSSNEDMHGIKLRAPEWMVRAKRRAYLFLTSDRIHVWWDKKCLKQGEDWEEGFVNGLFSSTIFMPILSAAAVAPFDGLTSSSDCDNLLLELRLALELKVSCQSASRVHMLS